MPASENLHKLGSRGRCCLLTYRRRASPVIANEVERSYTRLGDLGLERSLDPAHHVFDLSEKLTALLLRE